MYLQVLKICACCVLVASCANHSDATSDALVANSQYIGVDGLIEIDKLMVYDSYDDKITFLASCSLANREDGWDHAPSRGDYEWTYSRSGKKWKVEKSGDMIRHPDQSLAAISSSGVTATIETIGPFNPRWGWECMIDFRGAVDLIGYEWIGKRAEVKASVRNHSMKLASLESQELLLAEWVKGRPGYVYSPYSGRMIRLKGAVGGSYAIDNSIQPNRLILLSLDFVDIMMRDEFRSKLIRRVVKRGARDDVENVNYMRNRGVTSHVPSLSKLRDD